MATMPRLALIVNDSVAPFWKVFKMEQSLS
jgi:hypothetical protein